MAKTVATAPYLAALLASNTIGLELVVPVNSDHATSANAKEVCLKPAHGYVYSPKVHGTSTPSKRRRSSVTTAKYCTSPTASDRTRESATRVETENLGFQTPGLGSIDTDWRPMFLPDAKSINIRRLYPTDTIGRAHLAPVSTSRMNSTTQRARYNSVSSGSTLPLDTPSPVLAHFPLSSGVSPVRTRRLPIPEHLAYTTPSELEVSQVNSSSSSVPLSLLSTHGREPGEISFSIRPTCELSTSTDVTSPASRMPRDKNSRLRSSPPSALAAVRGHSRNESVTSIWSFGSSGSAGETPPALDKRKPLLSPVRPPVPIFFPDAGQSSTEVTEMMTRMSRPQTCTHEKISLHSPAKTRDQIGPGSTKMARHRSLPIGPQPSSDASESWDDDFSELSLNVPHSIRASQATLKGHLWRFRQFAELVEALKTERRRLTLSRAPPADVRISNEVDAIIAIASHGDESESAEEIRYNGAQDDTISRILGRTRDDKGKVRLNEEILTSLIIKAETLLSELQDQ